MKKVILFSVFISLCVVSSLSAQSTFLEKGQSGFGLSATVQESYWEDGFFGSLGYSFKGNFDINITYGLFNYEKYTLGQSSNSNPPLKDVKENVIGIDLGYWVIRTETSNDRGIDVGIWGAYEKEEYEYDGDKILSADGFSGGVEFTVNFLINQKYSLQPYFILGYDYEELKSENTDDISYFRGGCSSLGTALVYKINDDQSLVIKFELDNDTISKTYENAYEMSVGYYFGFGK